MTSRRSTAVISDDGLYRYRLGRVWNSSAQTLTFLMLNPSTADASTDDATIRKCIGFAMWGGYGAIDVVNLFALRATSPTDLITGITDVSCNECGECWQARSAGEECSFCRSRHLTTSVCTESYAVTGPEYWPYLDDAILPATKLAAAWGCTPILHHFPGRVKKVVDYIRTVRPDLPIVCLGRTKDGSPRHPSRLPCSTGEQPFDEFPADPERKIVACSNPGCARVRLHHESPHTRRPRVMFERKGMPIGGPWFCSYSCLYEGQVSCDRPSLAALDGMREPLLSRVGEPPLTS